MPGVDGIMEDPNPTQLDPKIEKFIANYLRCAEQPDESAIHDVRVAARRILAGLDAMPNDEMIGPDAKAAKRLRQLLKKLNPIRDAQVIAINASQAGNPAMDVPEFQAYLQKKAEKKAKKAASIFKEKGTPEKFLKPFRHFSIPSPNAETASNADLFIGVDSAYARCLTKFRAIRADHPESIHKFRVAFKKFRYTVEIASPRNAPNQGIPPELFEALHTMQTLLGDVQDADVMLHQFLSWHAKVRKNKDHPVPSPEIFRLDLQTKISAFLVAAPAVTNYWRGNPQAPFPWDDHPTFGN